jgi:GrpB-like predicted nucleotidyltransferase (UPF0157 family)
MTAKSGRQRPRPPEASFVVPYDPAWPAVFEQIRRRVVPLLRDLGATVEHVGSTAVPGLAAKPIVDVDVVVATSVDIEPAIGHLASGGYVHLGDLGIPGREAFDIPADMPYHHLYLVAHFLASGDRAAYLEAKSALIRELLTDARRTIGSGS